jgi:hypothetical protein
VTSSSLLFFKKKAASRSHQKHIKQKSTCEEQKGMPRIHMPDTEEALAVRQMEIASLN